jgi:hypothetical protein
VGWKLIVTDLSYKDRYGKQKKGFYLARYLKTNLDGLPRFLKKEFDCVGIISGSGLVGVGKTTLASQIGYYIAWIMAGGRMVEEQVGNKFVVKEIVKPKQPVNFSLDNVVFTPGDLVDRAEKLYKKYGKNQVIIYDEGRAGLDSAAAMTSINKAMQEFFQRCRVYGHIILVVLPNFFKLHEDYAVARSLFLVDCFLDKQLNRGYFNFYNHLQKEKLYYFGKRLIGVRAKYAAARESFWGRFSSFFPFIKDDYQDLKLKALNSNKKTSHKELRMTKQRNAMVYLYKRDTGKNSEDIARELSVLSGEKVSSSSVRMTLATFAHLKLDEVD